MLKILAGHMMNHNVVATVGGDPNHVVRGARSPRHIQWPANFFWELLRWLHIVNIVFVGGLGPTMKVCCFALGAFFENVFSLRGWPKNSTTCQRHVTEHHCCKIVSTVDLIHVIAGFCNITSLSFFRFCVIWALGGQL